MLGDKNINIQSFIPFIADNFGNMSLCTVMVFRPAGDLHHDTGTCDRSHFFPFRNINFHVHFFIDRHGFSAGSGHFISTNKRIFRSFDDSYDFPFRFVTAGPAFSRSHLHRVIVDRIEVISVGNIHIFMCLISDEKSELRPVGFIDPLQNRAGLVR